MLVFHLSELVGPRQMWANLGFGSFETTHLLTSGWVGVNIFYVLSGFLLTMHVLERSGEAPFAQFYRDYLRGRILRVVPAYWAQIAVLAAIALVTTRHWPQWIGTVPAHLFFMQNFGREAYNAINYVYWTLPVEFSFYLALPFVIAACSRRGTPKVTQALAIAAIAVIIAFTWRWTVLPRVADFPVYLRQWATAGHLPGVADQFGIGIAAAVLFRLRDRQGMADWAGDALVALGLCALVGWMYFMHIQAAHYWEGGAFYFTWHPVAALSIAILVFGVACGGPVARALFENRLVVWLGAISYSVYLWHLLIASALLTIPAFQGHGVGVFALLALPPILAGSAASYYFVERPFLQLKGASATIQ